MGHEYLQLFKAERARVLKGVTDINKTVTDFKGKVPK
jgi:hypothetical protein